MAATILVVEDEPAIQELIAYACRTSGFEVRRSDSVRSAREAIGGELPDLVLLDWMLPDRPGIELLRDLRMRVAADLLANSGLPVKRIAEQVGFASRSAFARAFALHAGVSPRGFRGGTDPETP